MNLNFEEIEKKFTPKPYHVRNGDFAVLAKSLKWLFQIICVAAGFIFIYQNAFDLTEKKTLSIAIAAVFLVAIEGTKQVLVMRSYEHYITYKKVGVAQVFFALLILAVSFSISKNGVERYYVDNSKTPSVVNVDSVLQPYRLDLNNAQSDKQHAYTLTWDGSKELTGAGQKMLSSAIDKIERVEQAIDSVRKVVLHNNETTRDNYKTTTEQKAKKLSWFVVVVDILLVVCLLYPVYFLRKSLTDFKQNEAEQAEQKKEEAKKAQQAEKEAFEREKERLELEKERIRAEKEQKRAEQYERWQKEQEELAEKMQKIGIKEAKEPPLPRAERGENSGFEPVLRKSTTATTITDNSDNKDSFSAPSDNLETTFLNNTDNFLNDLDNLTIEELKVVRTKSKKVVNELKRKGKYETSKAAQQHENIIAFVESKLNN